ncbi:AP-5 complex subunit beta-1 [Panicum miliaceum]|uniref:AP-5 complex subunit beta-1 n=1 Tax=Panicum miliaceum TaxID=4540 RepID=A0A3L6QIF9_PANMI|nr:AP-5 complex subunit beta-1 [Panicum miliaceum]
MDRHLSPQEWEQLLDDFSSSPSRRHRWLHLPLLDLAVSSLPRRDLPSHLKPLLLSLIDDHLLPPSPRSLPILLTSFLSFPPDHPLRGHLLVTVVSAFASALAAPLSKDHDAPPLAALVDALLAAANRPNHAPDRAARALACDALRALDAALPGLLAEALGHLYALAAAERSPAAQSYLLLLASAARHAVRLGRLGATASILAVAGPPTPFYVPAHLLSPPAASMAPPPSEVNVRDIRKVLALLMDRPQVLTPAAAMEMTAILAEIASAVLKWAPAIAAHIKVQFGGMLYSSNPMLLHSLLTLFLQFPDAFGAEDERTMARRLALAAREAHRPLAARLLALHWLLGSTMFRNLVPGLARWFYPNLFDPLVLKAKKLECLAYVAARVDGDKVAGGRASEQATGLLDDGLVCVSAFRWLPAWSTETGVAFRALHRVLIIAAPHSTEDTHCSGAGELLNSTIFHHLQAILVDMASKHRGLVPVIAEFTNRLLACNSHQWAGEQLLRTLDERLLPRLEPGYQLASYYPLFEEIAQNETSFPDLEVRDHARICLRMLSCVPGKKLRHLMGVGEQPSGITPSHPGSLFDIPSPRPAQDLTSMTDMASYIHLERIVPLVVKQSWALTLPNFSVHSRPSGHILSIQDVSSTPSEQEKPTGPAIERIGYTQETLRVMDSKGAETLQILRRYFACIPDYLHSSGLKIRIPCTFRFDSEPFNHAWRSDSPVSGSDEADGLPALYAVMITFSSSARFGKIPSCHVPFILGEPPGSGMDIVPIDNQNLEESSYCASVVIELEPREPSPGLIDVSIAANTENCQVLSGSLKPVTVGIEDMFMMASVPPDTPKEGVAVYYQDLFHALWEACDSSSNTGRETFPLSGGKGSAAINGTRSVKLMEVTPKVLIGAVERYLASFVVSVAGDSLVNILRGNGIIKNIMWEESVSDASVGADALVPYSPDSNLQLQLIDDDDIGVGYERYGHESKRDMGVMRVMIFLPPRYHLLFLMEVGCASTLVRIRTDHWPCLAYVDEYLEALIS